MNGAEGKHRWTVAEWIPFICIFFVYAAGMFVDVMEVDAAQYAHISRRLAEGGSWLQFFDLDRPYLDKPPLIFWLTAISFRVLGVSNFSYHLPSVLFSLFSVFFLYKTVQLWVGQRAAWFSALVLASCQAFFLMNLDVKTDMFLIGGILLATWQFSAFLHAPCWKFACGTGLGTGIALLAKGPVGAVILFLAFAPHLLLKKDLKKIADLRLIAALTVVIILLLPMCFGLYIQHGIRGLEFFFWTQSFGRITGESEWKNSAGPFFLVQNFAWAFLPWTGLFIVALFAKFRMLWIGIRMKTGIREIISLSAFLLGFLILSLSRFKLPHYIFVAAPFAAWILGEWLSELEKGTEKTANIFIWLHTLVLIICLFIPVAAAFYVFPARDIFPWAGFLAVTVAMAISMGMERSSVAKIALISLMIAASGNFLLNSRAYPALLKYQMNSHIWKIVDELDIPADRFAVLLRGGHATAFYSKSNAIPALKDIHSAKEFLKPGPGYIYTTEKGLRQLQDFGIETETVRGLENFRVSRLSISFLDPATRSQATEKGYLIRAKLTPQTK